MPLTAVVEQQLLLEDDTLLRKIFLKVLEHHHPELAAKLGRVFTLSTTWCKSNTQEDFDELEVFLEELRPEEGILVRSS